MAYLLAKIFTIVEKIANQKVILTNAMLDSQQSSCTVKTYNYRNLSRAEYCFLMHLLDSLLAYINIILYIREI